MTHTLPVDPASGIGDLARRWLRRGRLLLSAGAIALAGVAAPGGPARSQSADEILAFLLGAAAVAVIVRSFDSDTRSRSRPRAGVLPDSCLETVRLNRRNIDLYHAACLGWYGIDRLPRRCETRIRTNVGARRYFVAQCLYEANYRPESGWVSTRPVWESPAIAPRHHAVPPRPRDDRGWRSGRDHDRDERGWGGRDRDARGWGGRDQARDERDCCRRDRGGRDRGERDWNRGSDRGERGGWSGGGRSGNRGGDARGGNRGGGNRGGGIGPGGDGSEDWVDRGP